MAAGRLEGRVAPGWEAAAGLVAGIGLCLKPHHLLMVAGVEALLLYRSRDLRGLMRPELAAIVLVVLAYGAAIWIFAPGFVTTSLPLLLATYSQIGFVSLREVVAPDKMLKMVVTLAICWPLCRYARSQSLISVLLVAACGAVLGYIAQHKGWAYQLLPAQILFRASLCILVIDIALQWIDLRPARVLDRRSVAIVLAAVGGLIAFGVTWPERQAWSDSTWEEGITKGFTETFGAYPRGTPVYFMSTNLQAVFAIVTDGGYVWSSRWPALWVLPAILHNEAGTKDPKRQLPTDRVESLARELRRDMVEDFKRWKPAVVMVERCGDDSPWICYNLEDLEVDLDQWFARDPAFAEIWSHYSLQKQYLYYDVYVRDNAARQ
jgi:hypothetical protein